MSHKLLSEISERWTPQDGRCGRLVQRHIKPRVWHYEVALSDSWTISWGPKGGIWIAGPGRLKVRRIHLKCCNTPDIIHLPLPQIYTNLIGSVTTFHRKWLYGVHGWNCEHWARLVTTGKAKSYQVKEFGVDIVGARRNRVAESRLRKHIFESRLRSFPDCDVRLFAGAFQS